jgi:2-(1,2-epoxy-1,2-dihydrophenyl)acetyl-CoA isomerase
MGVAVEDPVVERAHRISSAENDILSQRGAQLQMKEIQFRSEAMTDYSSVDGIDATPDGPVLRLTIDRVRTRNALDVDMMLALIGNLEAADQDDDVRAVLLTGAGDDFCAGADLVARNAPGGERPRVGSIQRRLPAQAHRLIPLVLTVQLPVVCAVKGWAAGLGFHLALAADFCVVGRSARLWEPFIQRGFTPDSGGAWLLPRLAGVARARDLLLLGRELSGEEAADWGLVHSCVADGAVADTAEELVQRLATGPTVAVGLTKWLMHAGSALDLDDHLRNEAFALELSSRSQDFKEGLAAFREKRDPRFTGQ